MRELLVAIKKRYGDVPIFITETGYDDVAGLEDKQRISFHRVERITSLSV